MGRTESCADDAVHPGASFAERLLVGFAAGLVGAAAMNAYSRAMNYGRRRREATESWNDGCPPHGAQPPQAEGAAEEDELAVPLLGLSRGPRRLPARVHLCALAGHWVYGVALDTCLQAGRGRSTATLKRGVRRRDAHEPVAAVLASAMHYR